MAHKLFNNRQIIEICNLYQNNISSSEIARRYKCDSETIRRWLIKSRIKMRASRESLAHQINSRFFSNIDNEAKAYWLGFLVADGNIGLSAGTRRSIHFYLAKKDRYAVEKFVLDIGYKGKIRENGPPRNNCGILFNNPQMASDLIRYGYMDWKDGIPTMIDKIPDSLFHHFFRGFFDGDGCIITKQRKNRPSMSMDV